METKQRFKVIFVGDADAGKSDFIAASVFGNLPPFSAAFQKHSKHFIFKDELYALDLVNIGRGMFKLTFKVVS